MFLNFPKNILKTCDEVVFVVRQPWQLPRVQEIRGAFFFLILASIDPELIELF